MGTRTNEVLVEAYNSIGLVEHYYISLHRAYKTIKYNLQGTEVDCELVL